MGMGNPFPKGFLVGVLLATLAQGLRWVLISGTLPPGIFSWGPLRGSLVFNQGLAFSLLSKALSGALMAGIGVALLVVLAALWGRRFSSGVWALCWGGTLSNAFERWIDGGVWDYWGIALPGGKAPLFLNLADLFIGAGVLWALGILISGEPPESAPPGGKALPRG